MSVRPVLVAPDTYAVFDDEERRVHFERHSGNRIDKALPPRGYAIPKDYMLVELQPRWPAPSHGWVV